MELYALHNAFYARIAINPLSAGQIALWHALVYVCNKSMWRDWVSVAGSTLVQHTGLSPAGVKKARNELKQQGLIDFKPNGTKATKYKLIDIAKSIQDGIQDGNQDGSRNGIQDGSALINKKQKQETPPPPKGEAKPPAWQERFDRFWEAYPQKVGKDDARKAWAKRKPTEELLDKMLAALKAQKVSKRWQVEGGRYIPNPSTWLNQGRWEDEVEPAREPVAPVGRRRGYVQRSDD